MKLMIKTVSLVLSLAALASGFVYVRAEPAAKRYYGDLNKDGTVDIKDAVIVLRMAVNLIGMPSEENFVCADIDRNDIINTTDARLILRMAASLEPLEYINSGGPGDTAGLLYMLNKYRSANSLTALNSPKQFSTAAAVLAEEYYRTGSPALRLDGTYWITALADESISPLFADAAFLKGAKNRSAIYSVLTADKKTVKKLKNSRFDSIGIGCYEAPNGYYYWCVIFADIA